MNIKSKSGEYFDVDFRKSTGPEDMVCPKCSADRKKKNLKCFNWNHEKQLGRCNHCEEVFYVEKKIEKEYVYPVPKLQKVSDKVLDWFKGRGISNNTLLRFGITEGLEFMPQVGKERNCICFNYYRDEKLINIKFRDAEKNFKLNKGSELIFYNLDAIKEDDECIICEGEIDCLSFYEAGIYNCVSVPNGASKGNKLEYLDNCIEYFLDKKKIILAVDNDRPGIELRDELLRRLGREKCWVVNYPEGCKDANDVLLHGDLKKVISEAYQLPIEGIEQAKDIDDELMQIYENGYPLGVKTGMNDFDDLITWRKSELTVITGTPGSGKSTFLNNLLVKLANRNEWRIAMFSPEKQPNAILTAELMEIFIGKSFYNKNKDFAMTGHELQTGKDFINNHFWYMKIDEIDVTIDGIIEKSIELVTRHGINCIVIDPWNYIEHKIPKGYTETQYISEALTKVKRFKDVYGAHVFLIAHPKKLSKNKEGKYDVPTLYDISGSAHFFNKCDNGFVVFRDFITNTTEVHVQKIRWSFVGRVGETKFKYDVFTKRYSEINGIEKNEYHYHIDKQIEEPPFRVG